MSKVILLAEDSADDAEFLKRSLLGAGVTSPVHVFADGKQIVDYLNGEGEFANRKRFPFPSVLFLDLLMPGMDGWRVLEWIRTKPGMLEQLLVVVLTGAVERDRLQEAYLLGAHTFLLKPFKGEDMKHLVRYWPRAWDITEGKSASARRA